MQALAEAYLFIILRGYEKKYILYPFFLEDLRK